MDASEVDYKVIRREGDRVLVAYPSGETRVESDAGESSEWLTSRVQDAPLADYELSFGECHVS